MQAWHVIVCAWKRCNNIYTGGRCTILAARLIEWNWNRTMWLKMVQCAAFTQCWSTRKLFWITNWDVPLTSWLQWVFLMTLVSRDIKEYTTFYEVNQQLTSANGTTATFSFYSSSSSMYTFFYGDHIDKNMPVDTDACNEIKTSSVLFSMCQSISSEPNGTRAAMWNLFDLNGTKFWLESLETTAWAGLFLAKLVEKKGLF